MPAISDSQIIAILEASGNVPQDVLEQIRKIKSVMGSRGKLFDDLISYNLLTSESVEKLQQFIASLQGNCETWGKKRGIQSPFELPESKKRDILFARQAITESICTVEDINRCFAEQAENEQRTGKSPMLGQLIVKNHFLPVDRFAKIHREIDQNIKATGVDKLIANDQRLKISFKDNAIYLVENFIPERFGPYRIIQEVARGGMGVVYKAWDEKLKRQVALKVLKAWENPPIEEIQRFHREARLAASLHHPNIVRIYDAGVVDGVHYFTMDYVEGETLSTYLATKHPDYRESLILIREIALALYDAHTKGIIHRDVKPGNIIIDLSKRPLLTDFGLAKGINSRDNSKNLTQSGAAIGTPAYMSPEQAQGISKVDARSDIYSLGAVLYELLTGKPPFQGDAVGSVIFSVISKEPIPPSRLNPNLHPHVETICLKAMAKDREQRYATAREMAEDIDRFLYGETIKAKPISLFMRTWKKVSKNLSLFVPFIILMAIIFGVASFYLWNAYLSYRNAYNNYENGVRALENGKYATALKFFRNAARDGWLSKAISKAVQEAADKNIRQGKILLQAYARDHNDINKHYETELKRLELAQDGEAKKQSLIELQNLETLQQKNWEDLLLALDNFWQAFVLEPFNQEANAGLTDVYFRNFENIQTFQNWRATSFYLSSINLMKENRLRSEVQNGSLQVRASSENVKLYLFSIQNLYLRRVPIGWNTTRKWANSKKVENLQKYATVTSPTLDDESYLGKAPQILGPVPAGYYLLVGEAENCMQWRKVFPISRGQHTLIDVDMVSFSFFLKNYQEIPIAEKNSKHCFLSHFEVSCKEYQEFLEDPATARRYRELEIAGELRYIPRIANKKLWSYRDGKCNYDADPASPVTGVSLQDAQEYCHWLSKKTGNRIFFRLPFYNEWKWAAGLYDGRTYTTGDYFDTFFFCWNSEKPSLVNDCRFDVTLYDVKNMGGNVREWCLNDNEEDQGTGTVCGGSWRGLHSDQFKIETSTIHPQTFTSDDIGFRVVGVKNSQ